MNFRPIRDRVLVRPRPSEERTTEAGIVIPADDSAPPSGGTIVAIGDSVTSVAIGQEVIYGRYAGTEVEIGAVKLLLLREDELLCVLEEP